jgi:hypothetical protein
MQTEQLVMGRAEARDLYRKYKEHKHYSTPIDREVQRAYQLLAQGRLVIKALESIKLAGLNAQGLPKLAIAPADAKQVECRVAANGSVTLDARVWRSYRSMDSQNLIAQRAYFNFPASTFPAAQAQWGTRQARAIVPVVPIVHRPQRGLANYHVLFEAEWTKAVPVDPMLLRRIGKADLWAVLAMWDLTEVERAVLSTRV